MFEITGDHIAELGDSDLRSLIGRLCEAEARANNLSVAGITWGGDQRAKDGGVDVRVAVESVGATVGYMLRPNTGFQVKADDMPRGEILKEMKPGGKLRPVIKELADQGGAYIIVSSKGSVSDSSLRNRRKAMSDAVAGLPKRRQLAFDFYDRNRIASWVRCHPGVTLWVRQKIGKAVPGWRPLGSWSGAPKGTNASFISDDGARLLIGGEQGNDGLKAGVALDHVRGVLSKAGTSVRLVGLSGVGKTRFAEALFDATLGTRSLDPAWAIYTDAADNQTPPAVTMASDLIAARYRAVLIIDNCPPDLHKRLADICLAEGSTISLLTIEFDIQDEQAEGSDVFQLVPSSEAVIETLIRRRYGNLSQVDIGTIGRFSGGNARIALALASTVGRSETIAGLGEAALFKRLFEQRQARDGLLLKAAEACSLLYSFDGEHAGEDSELARLGQLAGISATKMFGYVAELKRRDLVQSRSEWRAVLPHAIANRLAALALQNIPREEIEGQLVYGGTPERILRSFSRRLGYLDGSEEAKRLVLAWVNEGGFLAAPDTLNELGVAILSNVAPVAPEAVLTALERCWKEEGWSDVSRYVTLIRLIAFDASLFDRAIKLLIKILKAATAAKAQTVEDIQNSIAGLFPVVLSATHATVAQRLSVVDALLQSEDVAERKLGIDALGKMLKTEHFTVSQQHDFGARSRDYGYRPRTYKEQAEWYGAVMALLERFVAKSDPVGGDIRALFGRKLNGLWWRWQEDAIERLAAQITATQGFWREGWLGVRRAMKRPDRKPEIDELTRLERLEVKLRPTNLVEQVRGLVLGSGDGMSGYDAMDDAANGSDLTNAYERHQRAILELGKDVGTSDKEWRTLLPELMQPGEKTYVFGRGVALSCEDPRDRWQQLVDAGSEDACNLRILCGFLSGLNERDQDLIEELLDEAIEHPTLKHCYPVLEAANSINAHGIARLQRSLASGAAPVDTYRSLGYGGCCDAVSGVHLKPLIEGIAAQPGGVSVALSILSMRIFSDNSRKRPIDCHVAEAGRHLLGKVEFGPTTHHQQRADHDLETVIKASLSGPDGANAGASFIGRLLEAVAAYRAHGHDYDQAMHAILKLQPLAALDALFSGSAKDRAASVHLLREMEDFGNAVTKGIDDVVLLGWCRAVPQVRFPIAAAVAHVLDFKRDDESLTWTPTAKLLLEHAPHPVGVLAEYVDRLRPSGWSVSLASALERRLAVYDALDVPDHQDLKVAFARERIVLEQRVAKVRKEETEQERRGAQRFE